MPSFTSNSDLTRWLGAGLLALIVWAAGVIAYERQLRSVGHLPTVMDTPQLWAQERSRVYGDQALVFIGASRTLYGIDLDTVEGMVPRSNAVMLALNGRYPLATLQALAEDVDFTGTLLVDVDARGLTEYNWGAQSESNRYFADDWTPSWSTHRRLLSPLQSHWVSLNSRLGWLPMSKFWLEMAPPPFLAHDALSARREGYLDLDRVDAAGLARMFKADLERELEKHPPPPAEAWLKMLAPVSDWVRRIEARGGRVVFFVPPVSGYQAALIEAAYPRARYWQRFIDQYQLRGWHYLDDEGLLDEITLPDDSHVDAAQKAAYTQRLLANLQREGLL
jgi:hypothetical protein